LPGCAVRWTKHSVSCTPRPSGSHPALRPDRNRSIVR
jgi:hypothetical protein